MAFCFINYLKIKFRKAKQIVVALIAAAFEAIFSFAKANGRISGREFYTGNIYSLFDNNFTHTFPPLAYKKVRPKRNAPKKCIPLIVATQMLDR